MIEGPPGFHVECKRVERLNVHAAMAQAAADAPPGSVPMVAMRRSGGPWLGVIDLDVLLALIRWSSDVPALMQRVEVAQLMR